LPSTNICHNSLVPHLNRGGKRHATISVCRCLSSSLDLRIDSAPKILFDQGQFVPWQWSAVSLPPPAKCPSFLRPVYGKYDSTAIAIGTLDLFPIDRPNPSAHMIRTSLDRSQLIFAYPFNSFHSICRYSVLYHSDLWTKWIFSCFEPCLFVHLSALSAQLNSGFYVFLSLASSWR
jgi:hypothetical protein